MKDGTEKTGYCKGVKIKKGQIHTISFADEKTGKKEKISAEEIAEAYLFASRMNKFGEVSDHIRRAGTGKRDNFRKTTTNNEIHFVNKSVSLKNKKEQSEFLMQLLNPEFDDYISVYYDPFANETGGVSVGVMGMSSPTIGGGMIKSFYIEKDDRIFWLKKADFKKEYENLVGDNKSFMEKYPVKSVKWN